MTPLEALARCQRAWEATQPQLFLELWPDDGLDEGQAGASVDSRSLPLVEPAVAVASPEAGGLASRLSERGGPGLARGNARTGTYEPTPCSLSRVLNPGAEPCRDLLGTDGESALLTAAPAQEDRASVLGGERAAAGASAPSHNTTGPDAPPAKGTRPAQEVTL